MEYYSAIRINDLMKFLGKWMELENIILSEVTQSQIKHSWYVLTDKWILAQMLRLPKIQFTDHMRVNKKEDQTADASVLVRKGNKNIHGRKYGDKV